MDPRNCSEIFKTGLVQDLQTKSMRKYLNTLIKEHGGLPANAASNYKKEFRKYFMSHCKEEKKKEKLKTKKTKTKTKTKKTKKR